MTYTRYGGLERLSRKRRGIAEILKALSAEAFIFKK